MLTSGPVSFLLSTPAFLAQSCTLQLGEVCLLSMSVAVQISNDRKWPMAHLVAVRFPSALHKNLACMLAMKHDEMKRWLEVGTDTVRRLEATL